MQTGEKKEISEQNGHRAEAITVEAEAGHGNSAYDPFANRGLKHPTNNWDAMTHLLKGSLGSGILGMSKAFQNGGLWFSFIFTPIVGLVCTYCVQMLVVSAHELYYREKIPALDFAEVAEVGFKTGPKKTRKYAGFAKGIINWFMSINLLGTCSIYLVFIASNTKQVVEFHGYSEIDVRLYILCLWPLVLIFVMIRDLKYLSPTSMLANFLILLGMIISFYYMCSGMPSTSDRPAVGSISTVPLFFATVIFALEGIGVVMPLENSMKNSHNFVGCPGVLNTGMAIVVILYTSVGFLGYLKYGEDTSDVITLNLPVEEKLAQSVKILMSIAILFTYFLQFYVPFTIIKRAVEKRWGQINIRTEIIMRLAISSGTVLLAVAVPTLETFMSLIGALCLSILGLVAPPVIETVVFWEKEDGLGYKNWKLYKNIVIVLFGFLGLVLGTYSSILSLVKFYQN